MSYQYARKRRTIRQKGKRQETARTFEPKPQYPRTKPKSEGINLWGSGTEPKTKPQSNQERLKSEFGDHSE